jgi:hypothetical protein
MRIGFHRSLAFSGAELESIGDSALVGKRLPKSQRADCFDRNTSGVPVLDERR